MMSRSNVQYCVFNQHICTVILKCYDVSTTHRQIIIMGVDIANQPYIPITLQNNSVSSNHSIDFKLTQKYSF